MMTDKTDDSTIEYEYDKPMLAAVQQQHISNMGNAANQPEMKTSHDNLKVKTLRRSKRVQKQRAQETEEKRKQRLQTDAARHRLQYQQQSEEEKQEQRRKVASRERQRREQETEDERHQRQLKDRSRAKRRREQETDEQRLERQLKDTSRAKRQRDQETDEERRERHENNASRERQRREQETDEERLERQLKGASRERQRREQETDEERRERQERMGNVANENCNETTMRKLGDMIKSISPFAAAFKMMFEVEQEEIDRAKKEKRAPPPLRMIFDINHGVHDRRLYNLPTANEVAAIFVGEDSDIPTYRHIAIHPRDQDLQTISILHPHCDPMIYPLLFPRGDKGWYPELEKIDQSRNRKRVSMLQFYSYRLAIRESFSAIHYGGKLFQQYIVDAYVKTEQNRLAFHRQNQKTLRVELYQGLMDHLANEAEIEGLRAGRVIILPSSFQGSPRAMQQNYQDAMAIVRKYGKPDLFITFSIFHARRVRI
ncbi:unnamed protein product [Rotaria sp. Silwood1]|nr:unnamed protein product [Rotaria sp. Silwood1]